MEDPVSFWLSTHTFFLTVQFTPNVLLVVFAVACLLLFASAALSATKSAFLSFNPQNLKSGKHSGTTRIIQKLYKTPRRLLATLFIANTIINIAIIVFATILLSTFMMDIKLPNWLTLLLQIVVIVAILLLLVEFLPKFYAGRHPLLVLKTMAYPAYWILFLMRPLAIPFLWPSKMTANKLKKQTSNLSHASLSALIEATQDKSVSADEKRIWTGIVAFGKIEVNEVMKPRTDVAAINETASFAQVVKKIIKVGYSRLPVYKNSIDNIVGFLYIKDLLPHLSKPTNFAWTKLLREAYFVPENKKIDDLLKAFQSKKMHMAVVVDEYGGCSGIVTLEDIMEEIVGEINDEFDNDEMVYSKIDDNTFVFEAKTTIINMARILQMPYEELDAISGNAESVAGLILAINGKIPNRNEKIYTEFLEFTIESVDKKRIKRVKVRKLKLEKSKNGK